MRAARYTPRPGARAPVSPRSQPRCGKPTAALGSGRRRLTAGTLAEAVLRLGPELDGATRARLARAKMRSLEPARTLEGHTDVIEAVSFSPDGTQIAFDENGDQTLSTEERTALVDAMEARCERLNGLHATCRRSGGHRGPAMRAGVPPEPR